MNHTRTIVSLLFAFGPALAAQVPALMEYDRALARASGAIDAGQLAEAEEGLRELLAWPSSLDLAGRYSRALLLLARTQAHKDDTDGAIATLRRAVDAGYRNVATLPSDDAFAALRENAKFRKLVDEVAEQNRIARVEYSNAIDVPYQESLPREARIAGLSKLWAEVKYNFAYFDQTDVDWDALYLQYLPEVIAAKDTAEYYELLGEMGVALKDGHTGVNPPSQLSERYYARPRFRTALIEDKVLVTSIHDPELEDQLLMIGTEITAIDDVPVHDYAASRVPVFYLASSTPQDLNVRRYSYGLLAGPLDRDVKVRLRTPDGDEGEREYARAMGSPGRQLVELKTYGEYGHLVINSFNDPSLQGRIQRMFPRLQATRGLIIDIRGNGGGSTPTWLLRYLAREPFLSNRWQSRSYVPSRRAWRSERFWEGGGARAVQPDPDLRYDKPVCVLIGPRTFSAAEDFASTFHGMKRGPLIGMPTGGSTGQPLSISLPGGGNARICTKRDTYADGRQFVGVGVIPDIEVQTIVDDVVGELDPVLERGLQYLRDGK